MGYTGYTGASTDFEVLKILVWISCLIFVLYVCSDYNIIILKRKIMGLFVKLVSFSFYPFLNLLIEQLLLSLWTLWLFHIWNETPYFKSYVYIRAIKDFTEDQNTFFLYSNTSLPKRDMGKYWNMATVHCDNTRRRCCPARSDLFNSTWNNCQQKCLNVK